VVRIALPDERPIDAGGSQDLWDIRELLRVEDASLGSAVTADVSALPAELQARWRSVIEPR
jgi:hypothetical protein